MRVILNCQYISKLGMATDERIATQAAVNIRDRFHNKNRFSKFHNIMVVSCFPTRASIHLTTLLFFHSLSIVS